MAIVVLISLRMDFYAMIYAVWLTAMVLLSRGKLAKIWNVFIVFVVIVIPLQYALVVGLPPNLCIRKLSDHILHLLPLQFTPLYYPLYFNDKIIIMIYFLKIFTYSVCFFFFFFRIYS